MIRLIVGSKGSGKTKALIEQVNQAALTAKGNVVCIEKNMKLTYNINHTIRLIDMDNYRIQGFDAFYGFFAGLLAGNYDITDIFVDGILKAGGPEKDLEAFGRLLEKIDLLVQESDINVVITVSANPESLPESVAKYPH
ncbi:MAG: hypothetical protein LBC56_08960 [Oscillospiraceae bacterium]|jgi:hypothetical protein|nr:hypothetical protein [Oscillospiraceae bacterium]